MPQKTNLNISPYYDDFNEDNNFYKVLFRPGRPVQARELTTLQSILQNQVESFGDHMFKEGTMVIPGSVYYDDQYFSVKVDSEHLGLPVSLYLNELKGKKLKGQNSGVEFIVNDCKLPSDSTDITNVTLFIKYLTGDDEGLESFVLDSEPLIAQESIVYGNTTINSGDSVANAIDTDASATGSAVKIETGVYFIRGAFVTVAADTIVLDPYSNVPSYRVGLSILETIVTAKDDASLYDNARGFSNYAAPGADRLKITTELSKKSLTDFNDTNFIEIVKLRDGNLKKLQDTTVYSEIAKEFARRTYEESGNYSLGNFNVNVSNSLDDGIGNEGIFKAGQITDQNNTPTDNLACVEVDPGKAYVQGFRINAVGTTILDIDKPRDKEVVDTAKVVFELGSLIRLDDVSGTPKVKLDETANTVQLRNKRKGQGSPIGIGTARVYSIGLRNSPYVDPTSEWNLYLYDIQTYTMVTLNNSLSASQCPNGSFIRGVSSDATGYMVDVNASTLTLAQTSGTFLTGEAILINESNLVSRSITSFEQYKSEDIKSVFQASSVNGFSRDFNANTVLRNKLVTPNTSLNTQFTIVDSGSNTAGEITGPGVTFDGIKAGALVKYFVRGIDDPVINEVASVSADLKTLNVVAVGDTTGVEGGVGGTVNGITTSSPMVLMVPEGIVNDDNQGLYAPLERPNVSDVDLSNSDLLVVKQLTGTTSGAGSITFPLPTGISSGFYSSFDTQKYSVVYQNVGAGPENLTKDQFALVNGATQITFSGLDNSQAVSVNATVEKSVIKEKIKEFSRSRTVNITKTQTGVTTSTSGLTQNNFYGLRVEDKEISLNVCDVVKVVAVLESKDTSAPTLDKLTTVSGLALDVNSVVGEKITGSESGAVAQLVTRTGANNVEIVYLNTNTYNLGEVITFEESNIKTTLQAITPGNNINITDRFALDKGQREQYYDYSRLVRKAGAPSPSKKLLVVYNSYIVPADDTGDVFTVGSYDQQRFTTDVPILKNNVRASDTLDFRPRVSEFVSTTASPFAFSSRDFGTASNASTLVVSSQGDSNLGYSFYLPRIDKLILSLGEDNIPEFSILRGVSSLQPKAPAMVDTGMHIATIALPAYLYNPRNARISLVDNKRYTMRDIGKLDKRVSNLEVVTSLTMLELDTKTLQVRDATGDRFKSGFFVDNFKDISRMDILNPDNKVDIDISNEELIVPLDRYTFKPEIGLNPSINSDTADYTQNLTLLDPNVRKTGDLITLDYSETGWIENAFASQVENVNPFEVVQFNGTIALDPVSDNWTRTVTVDGGLRRVLDGNIISDDLNVGVVKELFDTKQDVFVEQTDWERFQDRLSAWEERTTITLEFDREYIETIQTGTVPDTHVRSRNVGFKAHALKPGIRYYPFFDGRSGIDIIPKLIEISMDSGTFSPGETVEGFDLNGTKLITFRVANANHRQGDYLNPSTVYALNPYESGSALSSVYTSSSTVLNVDIGSLTEEATGSFFGRIEPTMLLVGQSSQATATVGPTIRLIGDEIGNVYGSFFIRDPLTDPAPPLRFLNGVKTFRLTSSLSNETPLPGNEASVSSGEGEYTTAGTLETFRQTNVQVGRTVRVVQYADPLAQSFRCDETGAFLSSVDIYFGTKDNVQPITVQVRTMELGTPTTILAADYAEVILDPTELDSSGTSIIKTSADASIATNVKFPSPIYLEAGKEYAVVLVSPGTLNYTVWIARMGDITIETRDLGEGNQRKVGKQYIGGSLFKSQNGTIWTPSQEEDLKFTLYKCAFTTGVIGDLTLYNPKLASTNRNFDLVSNAVTAYPRKLTVGITYTPALEAELVPGIKVSATTNDGADMNVPDDPTGFIENVGGPIEKTTVVSGTIGVTTANTGSGFAPSATYSGVALQTLTGNGSGATATVKTSAAGVISNVSIASSGVGYVVGDVLGITTSDLGTDKKGSGAQITIADRAGIDRLYLTNVQGENFTTNKLLIWYSDPASGTIHNIGAAATAITSSALTSDLYSGNIIEVSNYNHGMTSDNNKVTLTGIKPNGIPSTLSADLATTDTVISVANTSVFGTFEGISTSTGYAQVGQEIIYYNGIGAGTLNVGTRGYDGTSISNHVSGDSIFKYEFNQVSLTGINTTHSMSTLSGVKALKTIDNYYVQVPRGSGRPNLTDRSTGVTQLSFSDQSFAGGSGASGTQNFQYDAFMPSFSVMTPGSTTKLEAKLRSVTGTSDGGNEASFNDVGYVPVVFNKLNRMTSPRLLASNVDETTYLTNLPKNRSVTLLSSFSTTDANLSPVLDTMNGTFKLYRNRLNNPISNYATDSRSNALVGDPHAACYISQVVNLKNPSTSLKVLVSCFRPATSDFRVLYRLLKSDSTAVDEVYKLFPGYDNLRDVGIEKQVIDPNLNDGKPDVKVPASTKNRFLDYEFTAENEDEFTGFQIKIVMSGTNESTPPRFKDLRVIALA